MSSNAVGPTPDHIMQVGLGFWASKALLSAVEMGVFTELSHGPREFTELVARLGLHPRSARDFLDALVALGFLRRTQDNYCNAPDTELFLDRNKPSYIGGILEMAGARLYGFWNHLTEALRTGQPQNEAKHDSSASPLRCIRLCRVEDASDRAHEWPRLLEEGQVARVGERHRHHAVLAQRVRRPFGIGLRYQRIQRAAEHDGGRSHRLRRRYQVIAATVEAAPERREGRHRGGIIVAGALLAPQGDLGRQWRIRPQRQRGQDRL